MLDYSVPKLKINCEIDRQRCAGFQGNGVPQVLASYANGSVFFLQGRPYDPRVLARFVQNAFGVAELTECQRRGYFIWHGVAADFPLSAEELEQLGTAVCALNTTQQRLSVRRESFFVPGRIATEGSMVFDGDMAALITFIEQHAFNRVEEVSDFALRAFATLDNLVLVVERNEQGAEFTALFEECISSLNIKTMQAGVLWRGPQSAAFLERFGPRLDTAIIKAHPRRKNLWTRLDIDASNRGHLCSLVSKAAETPYAQPSRTLEERFRTEHGAGEL